MNIKFKTAYSDGAILTDGCLNVQNGRFTGCLKSDRVDLDLGDYRVFPGFIDMHTHGGGGFDSATASFDEFNTMSEFYAENGVAEFVSTIVTSTFERTLTALGIVSDRIEAGTSGAAIAGIYLEGMYLSEEFRGAHDPALLREICMDEISEIITAARGNLKVFAIAPEKENALRAISYITEQGVKVSLGHSAANQEEARRAIDAGAKILVHTYNAMHGLKHRDVGLLGMALCRDDVYCEMICDLIHVCPEALSIVLRCKNTDKVIFITDSMSAAGMPDGDGLLGALPVKVNNGIVRTLDGALAGSSLRTNIALKNAVEVLGVPIETAVKAVTTNPATALGMSCEIGSLTPKHRAHLTALDDDYNVVLTMVNGRIVYDNRKV